MINHRTQASYHRFKLNSRTPLSHNRLTTKDLLNPKCANQQRGEISSKGRTYVLLAPEKLNQLKQVKQETLKHVPNKHKR
jgi:hypothetical protein